MDDVQKKIDAIVKSHNVVLFMKGTPDMPQCGFSQRAVQILNANGAQFFSVNVLADSAIREGVKVYGNWPTIPQLYIRGQLIGGSDIMLEMHNSGELKAALAGQ